MLDEEMQGRVGFLIWIEVGGSPPISLASWLQVSVSRAGLQEQWGCSPANLLQEGRCSQASAGRRGELNEDPRSLAGC